MNIIINAARCKKCKDIIVSKSRYYFVQCTCKSITTDGGCEYLHRSYDDSSNLEDFTLYKNDFDNFDVVRNKLIRWNHRTNKYVILKDIDNDWLDAILEYYIPPRNKGEMSDIFLLQFLKEKQYRWELEVSTELSQKSY